MGENKEYVTYPDEKGSINISEEVIAIIAANAAAEVEGVASLSASLGKDIAELLGKKNISKGVKISVEEEAVTADVFIMVKIGYAVNEVGMKVQESVISAIQDMTGFEIAAVNVHICGISFDKER